MKILDYKNSKLVLGTAQFESDYGITSKSKLSSGEMKKILRSSFSRQIEMLDTAADYDKVEESLGNLQIKNMKIISKASIVKNKIIIKKNDLEKTINRTLKNLQVKSLYAFLLRRPCLLINNKGIWKTLLKLKEKGFYSKIGFSLYSPDELKKIYKIFKPDIVQIPINIIDNRFESSGWLDVLKKDKVEIHARSIFLQGLLLEDPQNLPLYFQKYKSFFLRLEKWFKQNKISNLEACLSKVFLDERISNIVIGINNKAHLDEIVKTNIKNFKTPKWFLKNEEKLINPKLWNLV